MIDLENIKEYIFYIICAILAVKALREIVVLMFLESFRKKIESIKEDMESDRK